MGRIVNKEQARSKPNEGFQLHHRELLIAAAHGKFREIKCLLRLLLHREEDAARQQEEVHIPVDEIIEKPAATALPPSEAITDAGDSILHVVASSGDVDEFLKCAEVIVDMANHLLSACNRKGDTPLHCAARLRNARMVSRLLALARAGDGTSDERDGAGDERVKALLRMQNLKGETVLHEAVRLEDKEMIEVLLSADSQLARVPLTDRASPLYLALSLGHTDIALQLLEKDKELSYSGPGGQNAFHAAILWKQGKEATERLLERNIALIKQADRSTGRTPLHYAALFGETRVTELLLSTDPSAAYLPDRNGSFPIHLAASNGQPDDVWALLQKSDSSKGKKSGHYCGQLRDGKGRTFVHVAVEKKNVAMEKKSRDVVMHACRWQGEWFASSVMNMQDDQGNTALHLAVVVGNVQAFNDLLSIPEVKLNLKNNKGQTPRELALSKVPKEPSTRYSNPQSRIYCLLYDAAHLTASPRDNILPREIHNNQEDTSQSIIARTQIIGLGSVLITTVTFAAAFAVPGGYRADGTPSLAGQYAFDAFVVANTLAFIFSGLSIFFLMVAGLGAESRRSIVSLFSSINFLACSAKSLGVTFTLGIYAVLAPVDRKMALACGCFTVAALMVLEVFSTFRAVKMVYNDHLVLVKRFGFSRVWWRLKLALLRTLIFEFAPYILISLYSRI